MDSGDRPVGQERLREFKPGYVQLYVNTKVPAELKWLVNYYKVTTKLPSFNWTIRHLLETHPALAKLAAELYTDNKTPDGPGEPVEGDTPNDRRAPIVARLFLGFLRRGEIPYPWRVHAFRAPPGRARSSRSDGGIKKWPFQLCKPHSPR